jgi:hypothetical protein
MGRVNDRYCFNPDFAVEFVMKDKNPIKTGVGAGCWGDIIVDYAEVKKSSKGSCWQECWLAIEPPLQNLGSNNWPNGQRKTLPPKQQGESGTDSRKNGHVFLPSQFAHQQAVFPFFFLHLQGYYTTLLVGPTVMGI